MIRRVVVAALVAMAAPATVGAQPAPLFGPEPPSSQVETMHLTAVAEPVVVRADQAGSRITLTLRVVPRDTMRVYAHDAEGYVPFTVTLDPEADVVASRTVYPAAASHVFPPTGETSKVYGGPVVVRQPVTLRPAARRALASGTSVAVAATLRYQACDDTLCYRPATARVQWLLEPAPDR